MVLVFFEEAALMMELPKRHATSPYGQPVRTHATVARVGGGGLEGPGGWFNGGLVWLGLGAGLGVGAW